METESITTTLLYSWILQDKNSDKAQQVWLRFPLRQLEPQLERLEWLGELEQLGTEIIWSLFHSYIYCQNWFNSKGSFKENAYNFSTCHELFTAQQLDAERKCPKREQQEREYVKRPKKTQKTQDVFKAKLICHRMLLLPHDG